VLGIEGASAALDAAAARLGERLGVDGPALLRERAAILGIEAQGTTSAGGTCRLLRAGDGSWVALNLARRGDVELLAAWMGHEWDGPPWDAVAAHLATTSAGAGVERAQLLGIPAAEAVPPPDAGRAQPVAIARARVSSDGWSARTPLVVDLAALWAGPLCTRILGERGAQVVKVELAGRPDGARAGDPAFWRFLNGDKHEVTLDPDRADGRAELTKLLDAADVVVTAARPRAIDHLGFDLERRIQEQGLVWASITGYGYAGEWCDRVAFGDDAAVAGGLAVAAGGRDAPVFVGDAPADPLAGMHAALAVRMCLDEARGAFVDVSMRDAVGDAVAGGAATLQRPKLAGEPAEPAATPHEQEA
jgi:hypothetical protein